MSPYHKSKLTYRFLAAYQPEKITFGVEAIQQRQKNYQIFLDTDPMATRDTADILNFGISAFVRGRIIKDKLGYFVRCDYFDPDIYFNPDKIYFDETGKKVNGYPDTEIFIVAGFDYMPLKNFHIMPNIWVNAYNSRSRGVSGLAKQDYDLVGRITIWWEY